MDKYYFSSVVTSSGILSAAKVSLLQKYFDKTLDGPVGFPEHPLPHDLVRRQRFRYCSGSWAYNRGQKNSLVFEVSGHIELYGLRLFGRLDSNYSVNLELINEKSGEKVLSQTGNFTSTFNNVPRIRIRWF